MENLKKELKIFKKEIKAFRKISQKDFDEGIRQAEALISKVDKFSEAQEFKADVKSLGVVLQTKEALLLYIENVTNIKKFGDKWGRKK